MGIDDKVEFGEAEQDFRTGTNEEIMDEHNPAIGLSRQVKS